MLQIDYETKTWESEPKLEQNEAVSYREKLLLDPADERQTLLPCMQLSWRKIWSIGDEEERDSTDPRAAEIEPRDLPAIARDKRREKKKARSYFFCSSPSFFSYCRLRLRISSRTNGDLGHQRDKRWQRQECLCKPLLTLPMLPTTSVAGLRGLGEPEGGTG